MSTAVLPLRFQVGARTLWSIRRRLVRVPLSLADTLSNAPPSLPPLPADSHGYLVTSLPEAWRNRIVDTRLFASVRQRYTRYHADLRGGFDAYWAGLSSNTRSTLKRKAKRIAAASGGALRVRSFRTVDELAEFHAIARQVSATTYQERLLDAGLPDDPAFVRAMLDMAGADRVRAWLLEIGDKPAAYLYCPATADTLLYQYVGHDPAFGDLSPGSVLHLEAMRDLFAEARFAWFDFTEGEGQHKRSLSTGGTACVDLLLLRTSPVNRAAVMALAAFDATTRLAKRAVQRLNLQAAAKTIRR